VRRGNACSRDMRVSGREFSFPVLFPDKVQLNIECTDNPKSMDLMSLCVYLFLFADVKIPSVSHGSVTTTKFSSMKSTSSLAEGKTQ